MAITDQDHLRDLLGEPIPDGGVEGDTLFSDEKIAYLIDSSGGDLRRAAAAGWNIKAAHYADLVDVVEGHSTRKMSQLAEAARKQVEYFSSEPSQSGTRGHVVIGEISRRRR